MKKKKFESKKNQNWSRSESIGISNGPLNGFTLDFYGPNLSS